MQTATQLLFRQFILGAALLPILLLVASCGGSGDASETPSGTTTIPVGGGTPGTTDGTANDAPPPTDGSLPTDDGATDDDGTVPPVDGGGDGDLPDPGPILPDRAWDGFENVVALATDPLDGTLYAINHESGMIFRKRLKDEAPTELGPWHPDPPLDEGMDPLTAPPGAFAFGPVRALAFRQGEDDLLAVVDRGAGTPDDLVAINPATFAGRLVGPIAAHEGVESLAWHQPQASLYGVDIQTHELLAISPATGDVLASRTLETEAGTVEGLAVDDAGQCLYGSNATEGVIYQLALLNVGPAEGLDVPAERLMGKTSDGKMRGLAFVPGSKFFYGVEPETARLYLSDPMGIEIRALELRGMTFCAEDGLLYATHVGNQRLVGINRDSLWKYYVGATGIPMLEGLADAEPGAPHLYAISSELEAIYQVNREDGAAVFIARVQGAGAPWTGLKSLAFRDNQLYAVDSHTGDLLRIDPRTGLAEQRATLQAGAIQSLAYDPNSDVLRAFSDDLHAQLVLRGAAPDVPIEEIPSKIQAVGGLGWDAAGERLIGSDLGADRVTVVYETPKAASMPYDSVHALAWNHDLRLFGADRHAEVIFQVDPATQDTIELTRVPGATIEAMAADHATGRFFLSDTSGPYLLVMQPDLAVDYVGSPGPPVVLASDGIKAMTWDPVNEVLYGVDLNGAGGATLVTIDPSTGALTAFPHPIGFESIEALTWTPLDWQAEVVRLVAVDRATRTLVEITFVAGAPDAGVGYQIGSELPEELSDVRGAALNPYGLGEMQLVDASRRQIYTIDSGTGELLR